MGTKVDLEFTKEALERLKVTDSRLELLKDMEENLEYVNREIEKKRKRR